ncbi:ExbD/TolR family protein [Hymenobacter cellulosivorans]|uniref:Biopolymer transporter ExbD n=1 Tax=Hymenobacter cellulosivorans TaxID=2932249 RepID=A0ABY4FBC5_9BACT|nr:biopolymer transporter ExbD [Hymenobacter cellulosivorans]UOQ53809.1 biopolymer transporter ExbD [Hymenobacter cellulosivorans]
MTRFQPISLRSTRRILHPDMTLMVGLGFLLVTFFLFTAELAKPTIMQLTMPMKPKHGSGNLYCGGPLSRDVTTLILGKNSQVHYYKGDGYDYNSENTKLQTTNISPAGLRRVLLAENAVNPRTMVIIKPGPYAKYRDLVDVLDEMNITGQKRYTISDMFQGDYELLKQYNL